MDFDQIDTIIEIAKHNSFSRAAEHLYRTQPAISKQVRSLEQELGQKLFHRAGQAGGADVGGAHPAGALRAADRAAPPG